MVIEFLTFEMDPDEVNEWLDVDERTWTRFLSAQDGFVSKQTWVERDVPGIVHAAITWREEASWRAIPALDLAATDAAMGSWRRPSTCRVFDVMRSA